MKRWITIVVVGLVAAAVIGYVAMGDYLPPRTAHKVARTISGLAMPSDAEVVVFKDEWTSLAGDGFTFIELGLTSADIARVAAVARANGYNPLPSARILSDDIRASIGQSTQGFARSTEGDGTETTVVVDTSKDRVLIHLVVF